MASIQDFLGADHSRCDTLFAEAEGAISGGDWPRGAELARDFLDGMRHHFAMEEEVLFPDFEETTGMTSGPTAVMRMEHEQMRRLFEEMDEEIASRNSAGFLGAGDTLLLMMQQHNAKEEQILYPMADRALGTKLTEEIARMQRVA